MSAKIRDLQLLVVVRDCVYIYTQPANRDGDLLGDFAQAVKCIPRPTTINSEEAPAVGLLASNMAFVMHCTLIWVIYLMGTLLPNRVFPTGFHCRVLKRPSPPSFGF